MRWILLALMFTTSIVVVVPAPAVAAGCDGFADWFHAGQKCDIPGSPGSSGTSTTIDDSGPVHVITHQALCVNGSGTCAPTPCATAAGESGYEYGRYDNGVLTGTECLTPEQVVDLPPQPPTPEQVLAAARALDWPEATLVIQPPDGETLVNFATNFYSTSTSPVTRTVALVRTSATVEATPQRYTWRFGDGSVETTTDPGAAYPELRVTHEYLRTGRVAPQLDVTYEGRYQLGDGSWHALPGTLTVTGTPQALTILTATPHLTG